MKTCRLFGLQPAGSTFTVVDEVVNKDQLAATMARLLHTPGHPECERLASEVESATLLIPLIDFNRSRNVESWLQRIRPYPVTSGIAVLADAAPQAAAHRQGYAEILLAAANGFVSQSDAPSLPDLVFRYGPSNVRAADLAHVLRSYGIPAQDCRAPGPCPAAVEVSIPGSDLAAWYLSPRQRTSHFYRAFQGVSKAIQRAMRDWLRFVWFDDPARFADPAASRALMMYWLSPLYRGRSRSEFSWEVLSEPQLTRLYTRSARKANRELGMIRTRLSAAGCEESIDDFNSLERNRIAAAVRREGRHLNRLMALDTGLVDTLCSLSAEARLLDAPALPRARFELATHYVHALRVHLRRGPLPDWSHDLAILVLIHATTALRSKLGLPSGIRVRLGVPSEGEIRFRDYNPRENVPDCLPLAS